MSHFIRPRPPRGQRRVRFNVPIQQNPQPQSILRPPPTRQAAVDPGPNQPIAFRRSSLPDMRHSASHLQERRRRALVALKDMQKYLKEACEFHGDDARRAISALSVNALSSLIAYLNALRNDFDLAVFRRDEKLLRNVDIDLSARHPAELLKPERPTDNEYERYARTGHRKRLRREAEHRLLVFVSKQLHIPAHKLRDLREEQREQRELDAFKDRLVTFSARHDELRQRHRNSSVPTSPAGRSYTTPHSSHTEPAPGHMRDELFPEGGDLGAWTLPGSSFDLGPPAVSAAQPRLQRQATPRYPRQSPYMEPNDSPYASSQPYTQPVGSSPYVPPMNAAPSYINTQANISSPYAQPVMSSSPYVTAMHSSPHMGSNANTYNTGPPSTPPQSYVSASGTAYSRTPPYATTAPAPYVPYAPYGHSPSQQPVDYRQGYGSYVPSPSAQAYTPAGLNAPVQPGPGNTAQQGQAYPQPLAHGQALRNAAGQAKTGGLQNYPQERRY